MPVLSYTGAPGSGTDRVILDIEYIDREDEDVILASAARPARPGLAKFFLQLRCRESRFAAMATDIQRAIGYGDHFAFWAGDGGSRLTAPGGHMVYGYIPTRREFAESEMAIADALADAVDPAGAARTIEQASRAYERGWRHVTAFSVTDPDGDPGELHVAMMTPISAAQFRAARRDGWPDKIPAR